MTVQLSDYLDLERMLAVKLQQGMAEHIGQAWDAHSKAVGAGDLDAATAHAESLSLEAVGPRIEGYAQAMMRAAIEYGAAMAAGGGRTLTSSLPLDRTVSNQVRQLGLFLKYRGSMAVQTKLLQSIAQHRQTKALDVPLQKAEALRDFQSFKDDADRMAMMVSGLHTSRLSGWGFTAEADMLGLTTYKLSAQLDNRTSKFCRFIHGKVFTIASAKRILDAAVYADDPENLKVLHPWPNQNLASMESYEAMSQQQLQDRGLGTPPFHPGCRTLMVRVDYKSRLVKPPVPRGVQTLPDYSATTDTFKDMGINMGKDKVDVWNAYMNVDPLVLLSTITKKPIPDLLGKAKGMIMVNKLTDIVVAWGAANALKVIYRTGSGTLELSPALVSTMIKTGEWQTLKATYSNFGATSALAKVRAGEAVALSEAGFIPDVGGWSAVQAKVQANLADVAAALTADQLEGVRQILVSTNPASMQKLHTLGLKPSVLEKLLGNVAYAGSYAFDETGLS